MPVETPLFDSAIATADRINDAGDKSGSLAIVKAAHNNIKDLTVADDINYYAYCGEFARKNYNDFDSYMAYADSMIQLLEQSGQEKNLASKYILAHSMKADALFAKGLYNESYDYYYKAQELAKSANDIYSLSLVSYSLGMVLYRQERFAEAVEQFLASYKEALRLKDAFIYFYRKQELLDNIGLCYFHLQKYDSAMLYYNQALALIDSNYMRFEKGERFYQAAKAVVYGNMADLYIIEKKYDTAAALLNKSISVNLQKGYINSDAILSQVKLARVLFRSEKMPAMIALLHDIKAELDTIPNKQVEMAWNKQMWRYYDHEKDYATAYTYLKTYTQLNDSLTALDKKLVASNVGDRMKSMEHQYQIKLLNKDKRTGRNYLIAACIIILMSVVIIIQVLNNARRSLQNVAKLTALNAEINKQKAELEVKDKDKTRIMRAAAHDIISPVTAISGLTDLLRRDAASFTDEQQHILNLIKESCDNSISISKNILEAAAETPKNMQKERVNINKLVASSLDMLSMRANAKHQHFVYTAGRQDIEAVVNKEKIWRVINNLVGNAIKFSYENAAIEIRLEQSSGNVRISVKDTGVGISEKNKPLVFDVFTEARRTGTSGESPHGLGLSISQQIAKAHNGSIWFESEEGKGSTFYFEFPAGA